MNILYACFIQFIQDFIPVIVNGNFKLPRTFIPKKSNFLLTYFLFWWNSECIQGNAVTTFRTCNYTIIYSITYHWTKCRTRKSYTVYNLPPAYRKIIGKVMVLFKTLLPGYHFIDNDKLKFWYILNLWLVVIWPWKSKSNFSWIWYLICSLEFPWTDVKWYWNISKTLLCLGWVLWR